MIGKFVSKKLFETHFPIHIITAYENIAVFASWNCNLNELMAVLSKVFKIRLCCSSMFNLAGL